MVKKTLLSLAIAASTVGLTACNISSIAGNEDVDSTAVTAGAPGSAISTARPIFSAASGQLPLQIDILFAAAATTDGTASVTDTSPVTSALNDLAGFSATSTIDIAFNAPLDEASIVAGSSVWLVEFKSKEDSPLIDSLDLASIISVAPTAPFADGFGVPGSDQLLPGLDYVAEYVEMDNGATPTIRVHPLKPLDPKTKYMVVVTDKLKDKNGNSAAPSVEYDYLLGDDALVSDALGPVRTAVKGWNSLAQAFLSQASPSTGVVLSYTFTTEANDDILLSMAAPENYIFGLFADTVGLEKAVGEDTVNAVVAGVATALGMDASTPAGKLEVRKTTVYQTQLANSVAEQLVGEPGVGQLKAAYGAGTPAYAQAVQAAAANGAGGLLKGAAHRPTSRDFVAIAGQAGVVKVPHSALGLPNSDAVSMQGMLTLPQFMAKKSDDGSSFWKSRNENGISSVGAVIDGAFGNDPLSTPPKDDDGTGNVTYRFPFAQHVEDIKVPVLVTYPTDASCSKPYKTIIFQHGITTDRTASLGVANSLASATAGCFATVAIDLPTHGLDASTTTPDGVAERYSAFNAFNVAGYTDANPMVTPFASTLAGLAAAQVTTFDGLGERHENLALNTLQQPVPMNFAVGSESGNSGDMFINLTNFQQTRDHLRQAVMDMLNLNASIAAMDIDGDGNGTNNDTPDLDASNVHFAGHSLGAVTGLTFVAVNNAIADNSAITDKELNLIKTAVLANPGGQLPKMLENSPSFSAKILPGLAAAAGLTQGMADLEKFFSIFQAPLDSVDPVNFTDLLKETNTPVLMFEMVGGGAVSNYDAANGKLPTALVNAGGYPADTVVPNNANPALNGVETGKSYLAGTDPLIEQLGLVEVAPTPTSQAGSMLVTKFDQGTHGTFSSADAPLVFKEMLEKTSTFMQGNGAGVQAPPQP